MFLGNFASIDLVEGDRAPSSNNSIADNANALITTPRMELGGPGNPIWKSIQEFSPGSTGSSGGVSNNSYDMDNNAVNETFRIDGGTEQTFDGTAVYNATITYTDGTPPATITAVIFQDTAGNTYLAPEFSANADQAALEAAPLQSIRIDSVAGTEYSGMTADRQTFFGFVCFVEGTLIRTPGGEVPVELLQPGDLVMTVDHGPQMVRWIGHRGTPCFGPHFPVRIAPGALGEGQPKQTLHVSRQHRVMTRSRLAERMFGSPEALVAAHRLVGLPGVTVDRDRTHVTYWHFMCDRHEVVFANGAPSETLFLGQESRATMSGDALREIFALFPELEHRPMPSARTIPVGRRQSRYAERLAANRKPVLDRLSMPQVSRPH
ncbi:Hint domain-containing protein [Rhodobacteraceae bacterium ASV31]|nr:Hint domain-containing protein [Anianabacter salinae]